METIVANIVGKVRREKLHGREHYVVPMSMLVPGVLNGSEGPLYYPIEEVSRNADAWNGMPIVVYHPTRNGRPVSARRPDVLDSQGIGQVFSVIANGKLSSEGWIDIELAKKADNRVIQAIEHGKPIELSTGLYTDNELAANGANHNGKPYKFIARNYRPDHLAILPDQIGACSLADGCGVLVNAEKCPECGAEIKDGECAKCAESAGEPEVNALPNQPKSKNTGQYKRMNAGTGIGETHEAAQRGAIRLSDRDHELGTDAKSQATDGYNPPGWAVDEDKWERAKGAADKGDYGEDIYWAVVAHIYQNMGGTIGGHAQNQLVQNQGETAMPMSDTERKAIVDDLVTNCDCWKGKDDRAVLNGFSDEKLKQLKTHTEKEKQNALVANAAKEGFKAGNRQYAYDPKAGKFVANEFPPPKEGAEEEDAEEEDAEEDKEKMAKNKAGKNKPAKPLTANEWMQTAPPEVQAMLKRSIKIDNQHRTKLTEVIVANANNPFSEEQLAAMTTEQLEPLARLAGPIRNQSLNEELQLPPSWYGANPPVGNVGNAGGDDSDDDFVIPTINYAEVSPMYKKAAS